MRDDSEAEWLPPRGVPTFCFVSIVGPNLKRFALLVRGYRTTASEVTVDIPSQARALSAAVEGLDRSVPVLVDLEVGMGRTGIDPGEPAAELYA